MSERLLVTPLTAGNFTLDEWRIAEATVFDRRWTYKPDSLSAIYRDIAINLQIELARERERHQLAIDKLQRIEPWNNSQHVEDLVDEAIAPLLEPQAEPAPAAQPLWTGFEMLDSIRASLAQAAELGTLEGVGGDIEVMNSVQILMDKAVAKRGGE